MIKALLKSIALVIGYLILSTIVNFVLYFVGIDFENTSTLIKMGLIEHACWLVVIGISIHWLIDGIKKIIGKG